MRSLESRIEHLEKVSPREPLVIRLGRRGEDLTPEEEDVLRAEERRRLATGEKFVFVFWDRAHARRLGAPAATEKPKAGGLGIRIACDGRPPIDL